MPDRVADTEWLYRRGYPNKKYMNPDGSATSRTFALRAKDEGKLSVDVASMTNPPTSIGDASRFALYEIQNLAIIRLGLSTFHEPLPANPAHAVIIGMNIDDEIIPGRLARASRRVFL